MRVRLLVMGNEARNGMETEKMTIKTFRLIGNAAQFKAISCEIVSGIECVIGVRECERTGALKYTVARIQDINVIAGEYTDEQAVIVQASLEGERAGWSHRLKLARGNERGAMGMTPDSVKESRQYQDAKRAYDAAHNRLREFNAVYAARINRARRAA